MRYYPYPPYYPHYGGYYPQPAYYQPKPSFFSNLQVNPAGIALILVGLLLVAYGLMFSTFKLDPKIEKIAKYAPDTKIYAVVFCDGICTGIEGEKISADKVVVHMSARELVMLANNDFVKQILYIPSTYS